MDLKVLVLWFKCVVIHMNFKNQNAGEQYSAISLNPNGFRRAKLIHITVALNSTRYLRNETEFLPWEIANMNMQYLHEMFDRTEVYGPMQV